MLHPQPLGAKCIIPTRSLILTPFPKHIKTFVYHFLLFRARSEMHKAPQCAYIVEQNLLKNLSGSDKMLRFSPTHSNTILPGFSPSAILLLLLKKYHYFGLLATPFGPGITFRTFYWTSKVLPFVVHKKLFIATVLRVELQ